MTSKEALEKLYKVKIYQKEASAYDYLGKEVYKEEINLIKQALERLEELEKENKDLKFDIDRFDDLSTQSLINNIQLRKENEKLKKVIKILKDFFDFDIYAGEGKGYIDCCVENPTFDLYNDTQFKEYELLKEVLEE